MTHIPIVDAHLDLAMNALMNARDLSLSVQQIRALERRNRERAMVSLPDFRAAGVALVCGTLFVEPPPPEWAAAYLSNMTASAKSKVYHSPEQAQTLALEQLEVYLRWRDRGLVRLVTSAASLEDHLRSWHNDRVLGLIVLMEGADPIVKPDDLPMWVERGVRMIGLSWGATRYAGGTGSPGPLTLEGRELLQGMRELEVIHDASHLAEESFWESLDIGHHALCASHSNARELLLPPNGLEPNLPANRHLSDAMIDAIGRANGMIGINLLNAFLDPTWQIGNPQSATVKLELQARAQAGYIAGRIGWDKVGIGSDIDAGAGGEETPIGFQEARDYPNLSRIAPDHHEGVMGENWLRFFARALPAS
jgi:membrane dipeptidase